MQARRAGPAQAKLLAAALQAKEGKTKVLAIEGKNDGTISADCVKKGDPIAQALGAFLKPWDGAIQARHSL